ncbi:MAG: hypothetical protein E3J72_14460 [Planctomycetota bacterium]|nr:MAG: hypothetical protein E3J72_14460 [Planctomycetota bacterium]
MLRVTRFLIIVFIFLWVAGCIYDVLPKFSPDGKYVAVHVMVLEGLNRIYVVELATKKVTDLKLPEGWEPKGLRWIKSNLLIGSEKVNSNDDGPYWLVNPATGECTETSIKASELFIFTGTFDGGNALYVPCKEEEEKWKTTVYSLDNLSNIITTLDYHAWNAGDGCFLRIITEDPEDESKKLLGWAFQKIEVYSPGAKKMVTIGKPELDKIIKVKDQMMIFTRVSSDHKKIVLGVRYGSHNISYKLDRISELGVFDLSTGKLLWIGHSKNILGPPVMIKDRIYAIELKNIPEPKSDDEDSEKEADREDKVPSEIVLAVHTEKGRKVILDIPSKPGDRFELYNSSGDRSRFVLQLTGKKTAPAHYTD